MLNKNRLSIDVSRFTFLSSSAESPERENIIMQNASILYKVLYSIYKNIIVNVVLPLFFFFVLTLKQNEMMRTQ